MTYINNLKWNFFGWTGLIGFMTVVLCLLPAQTDAAPLGFSTATVDASGNTGYSAALTIGPDGALHAAYYDATSKNAFYRTKVPPGAWSAAQTISAADNPAGISIAVGADGAVHVAYFSNAAPCSGLCYAKLANGTWSRQAVDGDVDPFNTAIAVDGAGNIHIAYSGFLDELKYSKFNGVSWSASTVDVNANVVPAIGLAAGQDFLRSISLSLDGAGNPAIAYSNDNGGKIQYVKYSRTAWNAPQIVDSEGHSLGGVSLALDGSGNAGIAYVDLVNDGLFYAANRTGAWVFSAAVRFSSLLGTPDPEFASALAFDGGGNPHIAFNDNVDAFGNQAAAYAFFNGVSWSTQTVNEMIGGAQIVSLALDGSGNPNVLYSDPFDAHPRLQLASATAAGFPPPMGGNASGRVQAPTNFTAAAVAYSSITWRWTSNASNALGFALYGAVSSTGPFTLISGTATIGPGQTSYTESTLTQQTTVYRYIAAVNAGGVAVSSGMLETTLPWPKSNQTAPGATTLTYNAPGGLVTVVIPAGSFPGAQTLNFSVPVSFPVGSGSGAELTQTGVGVQIDVAGSVQPTAGVSISLTYPASAVVGMDASKLVLARFDLAHGVWTPLPSQVDSANRVVTGVSNHFSLFQVMQSVVNGSLGGAWVYPNPMRPTLGHVGMIFSNLPSGARVRLYSFSGALVRDLTASVAGMAEWDGKNQSGMDAASGVYFAFLQANGDHRTIKVAIQR